MFSNKGKMFQTIVKIFLKHVHDQVDLSVIGWGREGKDKKKFCIVGGSRSLVGWGQGCWDQPWLWEDEGELSAERWRKKPRFRPLNFPTLGGAESQSLLLSVHP